MGKWRKVEGREEREILRDNRDKKFLKNGIDKSNELKKKEGREEKERKKIKRNDEEEDILRKRLEEEEEMRKDKIELKSGEIERWNKDRGEF